MKPRLGTFPVIVSGILLTGDHVPAVFELIVIGILLIGLLATACSRFCCAERYSIAFFDTSMFSIESRVGAGCGVLWRSDFEPSRFAFAFASTDCDDQCVQKSDSAALSRVRLCRIARGEIMRPLDFLHRLACVTCGSLHDVPMRFSSFDRNAAPII